MKSVKHIFTIVLATFVVIGSLGFSLFEHICSEEGKSVSYFIPSNSHDSAHFEHEHDEEVDLCCHVAEDTGTEDDCCNDEIKVFKANFDYFQDVQQIDLANYIVSASFSYQFQFFEESEVIRPFYRPPPPLSQRKSRSISQLYLI